MFIVLVCFYPNMLGHTDNYIPANPMVTPAHIVPEWYFLPFTILRSIPHTRGVVAMVVAIIVYFYLFNAGLQTQVLFYDQLVVNYFDFLMIVLILVNCQIL